ncbi:MAG: DUF2063 domain-containing protein [Halieaceae bacterium]|nr:DUF2063 domain-containing protein [Halieaceae bacterium]
MGDEALHESQMIMARYLRDPQNNPPPEDVEQRRLKIYEDLIYNNIEGFISSGFPVLRSLYESIAWHGLVREFIAGHRCHTPYFLEISQEFVRFLMDDFTLRAVDPPFIAELAHYEWVELALDTAEEEIPEQFAVTDLLTAIPHLSPLAWSLMYKYPVHRIGADCRPQDVGDPVYLVVYRNREDAVCFMEINAVTARLLELIRENSACTTSDVLQSVAHELSIEPQSLMSHGVAQLEEFTGLSIVVLLPGR